MTSQSEEPMSGRLPSAPSPLVNGAEVCPSSPPSGRVSTSAFWPLRITSYAPSHRQFVLDESLTPDQITKALNGIEPRFTPDGDKVTLQWEFWAELTYALPGGGFGSTSTCCKIWDYCESRWSAYGWPEAFEQVNLTPILIKDYGTWQFKEDGNPTLAFLGTGLASAIDAGTGETRSGSISEADESAVPLAADAETPPEPSPHLLGGK